jgi:hypothetical protein
MINAPCFNLLLAHPQLEAEYKQEKAWKDFTVRVEINWEEWVRAKWNTDTVEPSALTRRLKGSWREACAQVTHLHRRYWFRKERMGTWAARGTRKSQQVLHCI